MWPLLVPARRFDPEIMDRSDNPPEALKGALDDIHAVNRFLGGSRAIVRAARPLLLAANGSETLSILDVGTGGADIPMALVVEARKAGRRIRIVAVDRDLTTLDYARRKTEGVREIELCAADAFELPFAPSSFDLVTASMFLHHFTHDEAVRLMSGFRRVARRLVIVNDLERHVVPWALIGLVARATRRHPMFVHDAPLSVLRGFRPEELAAIARDAGGIGATVEDRFPYRLILTVPAGPRTS